MAERLVLIPDQLTHECLGVLPKGDYCHLSGETMGTVWSAKYYAVAGLGGNELQAKFEALFGRVIADFSNWEPTSTISQFNRAPTGSKIPISGDIKTVLSEALEVASATEGAFNPSLGAYTASLIFETANNELRQNQSLNGCDGWRHLQPAMKNTLIQPGGVELDLSAIAKGFAVDQMAALLELHGVNSFLVEIGGEFVGRGVRADGMPWWVTIEGDEERKDTVVALCSLALATSGMGYRYMKHEGVLNGHILQSVPHHSPTGLSSVSVLHQSCMKADAWATALYALGAKEGPKTADELNIMALFKYQDNSCFLSRAIQPLAQ